MCGHKSRPARLTLSTSCSDYDCDADCNGSDDDVTIKWKASAGPFIGGNEGEEVTWQAPLTPGTVTITARCDDDGTVHNEAPDYTTFSIAVVGVGGISYKIGGGSYQPVPDPLVVAKGTTVTFKASPNPSGASWPSGKPVWGGTSGASGTGETKTVTFNTASTSTTNYKTVTAECGNTVTENVLVVEVDKIQYDDPYDNPDGGLKDVTGTIYIYKGDTVDFKAIPNPSGASWPSGKPVWGGTSGASGSGETKTVTFNTASTGATDYKTVTAECGNTVTANVVVKPIQTIVAVLEGQNFAAGWTAETLSEVVMAQSWYNTGDEFEDYIVKLFEEDADWSSPRADDWVEGEIVEDGSGNPRNKIAIVGFSNGGDGAKEVAIQLDDADNTPDLLFLFDPIGKPWHVGPTGTVSVPSAIGSVINIYQRQDPFWFPVSFVLQGYSVSPGTNINSGMSDYEQEWNGSGYDFVDLTIATKAHIATPKVRTCTTTHTVLTPEHSPHTTDIDSIARLNTAISGVAP